MKVLTWLALAVVSAVLIGCGDSSRAALADNATENEWIVLFDGTNVDAWRRIHAADFPVKGWKIADGTLMFDPADGRTGDLITRQKFSHFEFELEFKLSKAANSGIKYFVVEELSRGGGGLGLEYQVLDDENHGDAKQGRDGNRTQASLYDILPAAADKPVRPIGEWNTARIVSRGTHVEHWLNGKKVLEFDRGSEAFAAAIAASKFKDTKDFGLAESGHILLQDHNDAVWFRNIRIRKL